MKYANVNQCNICVRFNQTMSIMSCFETETIVIIYIKVELKRINFVFSDLPKRVSVDDITSFVKRHALKYKETSARLQSGLNDCFDQTVSQLILLKRY